jgi:DSF synthase
MSNKTIRYKGPSSVDFACDLKPFRHDFYADGMPRVTRDVKGLCLNYDEQIVAELENASGALWITMQGDPHSLFTPQMLTSYISLVSDIENRSEVFCNASGQWPRINYVIIRSGAANCFSLGGDLSLLVRLIGDRDLKALKSYAKACLEPLIRFSRGFHLPLVTISLVQGRCFGGGFELALAGDLIIAEKQATFALPDIRLNLFAGMGATTFLLRKVGERALKIITDSGKQFSAQEMLELGVVDQVVERGRGEQAVRALIRSRSQTVTGHGAMAEARRIARGDMTAELMRITELWVNTAMKLNARELVAMQRLARR